MTELTMFNKVCSLYDENVHFSQIAMHILLFIFLFTIMIYFLLSVGLWISQNENYIKLVMKHMLIVAFGINFTHESYNHDEYQHSELFYSVIFNDFISLIVCIFSNSLLFSTCFLILYYFLHYLAYMLTTLCANATEAIIVFNIILYGSLYFTVPILSNYVMNVYYYFDYALFGSIFFHYIWRCSLPSVMKLMNFKD